MPWTNVRGAISSSARLSRARQGAIASQGSSSGRAQPLRRPRRRPTSAPPRTRKRHVPQRPTPPCTPAVLLAEDFEDARELYRDYLEFSGFSVETATNGREAIEQADALQPDIILMDASMPVLDGWQATRALKADPGTKHIPILALTAHAFDDARQEAQDGGLRRLRHQALPARRPGHPDPRRPRLRQEEEALDRSRRPGTVLL